MKCDQCGKKTENKKRGTTQEIKGQNILIEVEGTYCPSCKAFYYTSDQAQEMVQSASDAYRSRNELLTSKEIVEYRNKLRMSQAEFSRYIPLAIASLKRYEGIGIQDRSADELIRLKCDKDKIESAASELQHRLHA